MTSESLSEAKPEAKPYKGPDSYEIEDADYFFGRNHETEALVAKILSSRCTLLHAQSGTGKTSLLNARVLPALEEHGCTAFRILLRGNPSDAVRTNTLLGLLPPPEAEWRALERVLRQFWPAGEDPTLKSILKRFDDQELIPPSDPRRREAIAPVTTSLSIPSAGVAFSGSVRPLFLRLLRATLETSQYSEHLAALGFPPVGDDTTASELRALLTSPAAAASHADLLTRVYIPTPSLRAFFENLMEVYGKQRSQFALGLVLDQFEELFTLFADDPASPDKQLWRLRWTFINQLEELYVEGAKLPIRLVISMRDEYIAQLDPFRRFIRDLDSVAFHLSFLEKEEARFAVSEPAKMFGYTYSAECYANIFESLVREDRFVEPAPLQIVCEKLWREQGRALASASGLQNREVQFSDFPAGGTRAILNAFFVEALNSLPARIDRLETLEMLEPLVTLNRTRNIVEKRSLVRSPFRVPDRRDRLLENLKEKRIVRIEHRLGGEFVEITHEFLISSILDHIRTVLNPDREYRLIRAGAKTLERFEDINFRLGSRYLLKAEEFRDLHESRAQILWNDWSSELMYRSAVAVGATPEVIREWAGRFRATGTDLSPLEMVGAARMQDQARRLLSLDELEVLNAQPPAGLTAEQIEFIFRSEIQQAGDRDAERVLYWTRELMRACQEETRF